jgi:hypothetical protein
VPQQSDKNTKSWLKVVTLAQKSQNDYLLILKGICTYIKAKIRKILLFDENVLCMVNGSMDILLV